MKETEDLARALLILAALMAAVFKDGVQATDAVQIYEKIKADPQISAALMTAYNEANKVPAELKQAGYADWAMLVVHLIPDFENFIKSVKG